MKYPQWMDDAGLMAKSRDERTQKQVTLVQHTWDVLSRLKDQYKVHGDAFSPRVWQQLYWGCFLHDFGKVAVEFQAVLNGNKETQWSRERHRHEILSLAFVDWIFPKGHEDREAIIGIIAYHHKDFDYIVEMYGGLHPLRDEEIQRAADLKDFYQYLGSQVQPQIQHHLWRWLHECGVDWLYDLQIAHEDIPLIASWEEAKTCNIQKSVFNALRDLTEWRKIRQDTPTRHLAMLARGVILTSDHAASANAGAFTVLDFARAIRIDSLAGKIVNSHQQQAASTDSLSNLLIAPTGSGKTEAALLWALRQQTMRPYSRLFYTLPYQASMNAMEKRLKQTVFAQHQEQVAIQHSRATLKFYQEYMESDSGTERTSRQNAFLASEKLNRVRLNYYSVQVFSPYQMLKAAFQLKGYEALLLDYTNGVFIFDEIHAYDPQRMAKIVCFISWLKQYFGARFLVMTATMPPTVKHVLMEALALTDGDLIVADDTTFVASRRHIVRMQDSDLLAETDQIIASADDGNNVLVVLNQVKRAQEFYEQLGNYDGETMLLHGRFNGTDRVCKEKILADWVGVGTQSRLKGCIVVATQVVEVSLNVDFDVLYSDPAPLEALLQRFGRVNRGRSESNPVDVIVFRQPVDKKALMPYDPVMVSRSLEILEQFCLNRPIDEAQVMQMLEAIYDEDLRAQWMKDYRGSYDLFDEMLRGMKPYQSADAALVKKFYANFDGYQVLPSQFLTDFQDILAKDGLLPAMGYFVNISTGQYHMLTKKGLVQQTDFPLVVDVPYDSIHGLRLQEAMAQRQVVFLDEDI